MTFLTEIRRLKAIDFALAVCLFLAVFSPGFLTLYLFKPQLILELDFIKLMLFSTALTLPVFSLNTVFLGVVANKTVHDQLHVFAFIAGVITMISFYGSLMAAYFLHLPFPKFFLILSGLTIFLFLIFAYVINKHFEDLS